MPENAHAGARPWRIRWFIGLAAYQLVAIGTTWIELNVRGPKVAGYALAIVSWGAQMVMVACTLALPICALGCVVFLFSRRPRLDAVRTAAFVLATGAAGFAAFIVQMRVWHLGFTRLADDSAPLVAAIRKYEGDRGAPPTDLDSLVASGYLSAIPATPCGCSTYRYERDGRRSPWTLTVNPPFRGVGFDRFEYWSKLDYPLRGESGWYERIGDWAYFHE